MQKQSGHHGLQGPRRALRQVCHGAEMPDSASPILPPVAVTPEGALSENEPLGNDHNRSRS